MYAHVACGGGRRIAAFYTLLKVDSGLQGCELKAGSGWGGVAGLMVTGEWIRPSSLGIYAPDTRFLYNEYNSF